MAHSAVLAVVLVLAAAAMDVRAARFGDRLAPRVPSPYAGRAAPGVLASAAISPPDLPNNLDDEYEETADVELTNDSTHEGGPVEETAAEDPVAHVEHNHQSVEESESPALRRPSRTEAHRLEMSTEYFVIPQRPPPPSPVPTAPPTPPPASTQSATSPAPPRAPPTGALRSEPWAVPVLALACACMLTIACFEAFVVWGARRTAPSRRHLLLGQTLLLGLFSCAATAALVSAAPSAFSCGAIRFGAGASYAIVFASLLVKCVFLLSLNGGVYLPAAYQALLLFFAVLIQVAIGTQWLGGTPPRAFAGRCEAPLSDLLLSLCYAAFLIALVAGVALRSRGIRDNYREATHIAAAAGATAVVWVCWVAAALGAPERHRDACVAAGLLATCAVVFSLMFAPKGRRLVAIGKEGRYDADRDEGLSSLGRAGSGYSPSFFHFKPVKYGIVTTPSAVPPPPPPADHKEPPVQPADRYAAMAFASTSHFYARSMHPPQYYPAHAHAHHNLPAPFHYHYSPYHYLVPPGVVVRAEDGNVYTTLEPTFSSNPNVYFQRTEGHGGGVHPGMMLADRSLWMLRLPTEDGKFYPCSVSFLTPCSLHGVDEVAQL